MEGSSKKVKGLMDVDNSVVMVGDRNVRELNGSRKNTIIFFKKTCLQDPVSFFTRGGYGALGRRLCNFIAV